MTLSIEFLTLCDYATTSQDGKLSIIGIFHRIFTQKLPSNFGKFYIVALLKGSPDSNSTLKLIITGPQGEEVAKAENIKIKLSSDGRANLVTTIGGLFLKSAGEYQIVISQGKNIVATKNFRATKLAQKEYTLPN